MWYASLYFLQTAMLKALDFHCSVWYGILYQRWYNTSTDERPRKDLLCLLTE